MKRVLFGIGGGVAAFKAAEAISRLRRSGIDVRVVMTKAATRMVGSATFAALSGHAVLEDLFESAPDGATIPHVALADWADWAVVAPATADLLGRLALGFGDDLLTTTLLAFPGLVLVAPAMNRFMWSHPAVQENLERLRGFGYRILPPGYGRLAEGDDGWARMAEPDVIVAEIEALERSRRPEIPPPTLAGLGVLVTAGPTWEAFDPVRLITNPSSGRMGWALALASSRRGARVTLVAGPTELPDPPGVTVVRVRTACEMEAAVRAAYPGCRVVLAAAAVSDWRPAEVATTKLKKEEAAGELVVRLVRNPDILAGLGREKGDRVLVGFAAEAGGGLDAARRKLEAKNLDLVVFNDASAFRASASRCVILDARGLTEEVGPTPKRAIAERILDRVELLLAERPQEA